MFEIVFIYLYTYIDIHKNSMIYKRNIDTIKKLFKLLFKILVFEKH